MSHTDPKRVSTHAPPLPRSLHALVQVHRHALVPVFSPAQANTSRKYPHLQEVSTYRGVIAAYCGHSSTNPRSSAKSRWKSASFSGLLRTWRGARPRFKQ